MSVILYNVVTYGYDVNKYISIKSYIVLKIRKWIVKNFGGAFECYNIKYLVFALEIKLGLLNEVTF